MKYERFEDLPVWKDAIELAVRVYILTEDKFFNQPGDLRSQLRRSSLSVSNNIAEGFERGSTAELLAFLYISRGSCGETRSMLIFTERFLKAAHLKSEISHGGSWRGGNLSFSPHNFGFLPGWRWLG